MPIGFTEVKAKMQGQEVAFISRYRNEKELNGYNQPCPGCGGTDRYRATKSGGVIDGGFFCSKGGGYGDVFNHVAHTENMSFGEVLKEAKVFLNLEKPTKADLKASEDRRQRIMAEKAKLVKRNQDRDYLRHYMDELIYAMDRKQAVNERETGAAGDLMKALACLYPKQQPSAD